MLPDSRPVLGRGRRCFGDGRCAPQKRLRLTAKPGLHHCLANSVGCAHASAHCRSACWRRNQYWISSEQIFDEASCNSPLKHANDKGYGGLYFPSDVDVAVAFDRVTNHPAPLGMLARPFRGIDQKRSEFNFREWYHRYLPSLLAVHRGNAPNYRPTIPEPRIFAFSWATPDYDFPISNSL